MTHETIIALHEDNLDLIEAALQSIGKITETDLFRESSHTDQESLLNAVSTLGGMKRHTLRLLGTDW